jgi:tetratricopeptide (TPR) repeat protein
LAEAVELLREAIDQGEIALQQSANHPAYREHLCETRLWLAKMFDQLGRQPTAQELRTRSLAEAEALTRAHPTVPKYLELRAHCLDECATAQQGSDPAAALKFIEQAVASNKAALAINARNLTYRQKSIQYDQRQARILRRLEKIEDSERSLEKALTHAQQLVKDYPNVPNARLELAKVLINKAVWRGEAGRMEQEERCYNEGLAILKKLVAEFPAAPEYQAN